MRLVYLWLVAVVFAACSCAFAGELLAKDDSITPDEVEYVYGGVENEKGEYVVRDDALIVHNWFQSSGNWYETKIPEGFSEEEAKAIQLYKSLHADMAKREMTLQLHGKFRVWKDEVELISSSSITHIGIWWVGYSFSSLAKKKEE